ncbi:hypothetical protein CQA49_09855 [Helicobacter sp. MIT 00-7814]|uniref:hypothetical protein n=1 Tax=unclassified Helicobacter TaxID=2593540 RepID=UPI000E3861C6|nr:MULTISPECIES: hypothetical protein [unclassified Helicobacter]RDU51232.1 hypothetical protein CQA49_09855 [Helicobacter sp. MIT 00-7814]RDU51777.1 hypothetical protein CQA37_09375 [Helicobacter sp. MIT 99-10781]
MKNSAYTQSLRELEISPLRRTPSAPHSEISAQPTNLVHNPRIFLSGTRPLKKVVSVREAGGEAEFTSAKVIQFKGILWN